MKNKIYFTIDTIKHFDSYFFIAFCAVGVRVSLILCTISVRLTRILFMQLTEIKMTETPRP